MKKYFIVFIILFILMGVFSMDILGRSITDIQRRMVDQTNYRINVVKGIVAIVNINGTFGCYIAGETVIYPTIPTFSRDPKLQIGDEVTIEFINGCRETPVILAPEDIRERPDTTLPVTAGFIYVAYTTNWVNWFINSYDNDGGFLATWAIEATENIGNALAVDENDNVYTITSDQHYIKKRDSGGVLTLTKTEAHWMYNIAVGPDGYIYTMELKSDSSTNQISKRNLSDLVAVDTISLGNINTYYGMAIDSDGNFYLLNTSTNNYEKWGWIGGLVDSVAVTGSTNLNSLGVSATLLADIHWLNHALTRPKDFTGVETDVELEDMTSPGACGSAAGEYFLYTGYDAASMLVLGKYDITLTKVWTVVVPGSGPYGYGPIGAYPF